MNRFRASFGFVALLAAASLALAEERSAESAFDRSIAPFFAKYCVRCHGPETREADFSVHGVTADLAGANLAVFENALEMVSIGDMPPEDEPQPTEEQREAFLDWIQSRLESVGRGTSDYQRQLPRFANRVNHEDLFSGEQQGPAYTKARVWRLNEHIYSQLVLNLELERDFVPPLNPLQGDGFDDYSLLYADEATIRTMMQNSKRVAMTMVHGRLIKPRGAGAKDPDARAYRKPTQHRPLAEFAALTGEPTREQMEDVVRYTFDILLHREPNDEELQRYVSQSLTPNVRTGGSDAGLQTFLVSVLLSPEFLFRMEMGLGKRLPDGRRMLSPHELAYALSFALHDEPVSSVLRAVDEGRLETREDVEREARALLDDPNVLRGQIAVGSRDRIWQATKPYDDPAKPRLLRFFQEYFDYAKAPAVFKDDSRHGGLHDANRLVKDANWLVLSVLAKDRHVLETLLTTDHYMVDYFNGKREKAKSLGYATVYDLPEPSWSTRDTVAMPAGQRAGMLTHPAWLVAHSGNFETDPVRRGKWIQEHLLGGIVPELPIGVPAQLPEEPHHTIRQRFRVVRESECWRCHRKMNPLGEPLEAYDDFGRFRDQHHVTTAGKVLASELELNRFNRGLEAEPKLPVDTSGRLEGTGDPALDGDVKDAIDLVHRLAKSDRVRQVFLRHVFRYWMGRNETLDDSPTLMAMDRAYVDSGGSLQETLVALFTSDSFLYRK